MVAEQHYPTADPMRLRFTAKPPFLVEWPRWRAVYAPMAEVTLDKIRLAIGTGSYKFEPTRTVK